MVAIASIYPSQPFIEKMFKEKLRRSGMFIEQRHPHPPAPFIEAAAAPGSWQAEKSIGIVY